MSRSIVRVVYAACLVLFVAGCGKESVVTVPDLDSIPTGLNVTYSPPLVEAQQGGRSGDRYTWTYSTSVSATGAPVTIQEYGVLVWADGTWAYRDEQHKSFPAKMFAEKYGAANATVLPGKVYTCDENWSGADQLRSNRSKWYFIGIDERGRCVKGEAIIEELPRLKKKS